MILLVWDIKLKATTEQDNSQVQTTVQWFSEGKWGEVEEGKGGQIESDERRTDLGGEHNEIYR